MSLRDFRPLRYSSRYGHAKRSMSTEGETLQVSVLDMSTLGDVEDVNSVIKFLPHMWQELDYRIDICHVTKGGHIEHL